jgi:predicted dehydrogenase
MKVKIISAGSIGNHLAQASRRMGWDVTVVDIDSAALRRMREEIYPKRYGAWDNAIQLATSDQEPRGGFDIIMIGTPPDVRMRLALRALEEKPKILQLEKPLCTPSLDGLEAFLAAYRSQKDTVAVVGYDHGVAESVEEMARLLASRAIGEVETLDVEFREHWQGIFSAHPWLKGPEDTYLGYARRGGGAAGEHSHALHLWQLFAKASGIGAWSKVASFMDMRKVGNAEYDAIASFSILTDKNKIGRVVQDVVTLPVRKWARAQGKNGFVEWFCGGHPEGDLLRWGVQGKEVEEKVFKKKRPDDFYREMLHIKDILDKKIAPVDSPISLESGVAVMRVVAVAHQNRNSHAVSV